MTQTRRWGIGAGLCIGIGLLTGSLAFAGPWFPSAPVLPCSLSTLRGQYVYTATGTSSGAPYAESGWEIYDGKGTVTGSYTASTDGTISSGTYTGAYTVNSNCTGTETSPGYHENDFIAPSGNKFTWIETDPDTVFAGSEWRSDQ